MKKMITPTDLQVPFKSMDASGHYDWKKQTYQLENCKFGTYATTSSGTYRGSWSDTNWDNVSD